MRFLRHALHAALSGAFLVAYLTGDEDTYRMHVFAGYLALIALAARLALAGLARPGSPLALIRPRLAPLGEGFAQLGKSADAAWRLRGPSHAWMIATLLAATGAAAASGILAESAAWLERPHEALAQLAVGVLVGHLVVVLAPILATRLEAFTLAKKARS